MHKKILIALAALVAVSCAPAAAAHYEDLADHQIECVVVDGSTVCPPDHRPLIEPAFGPIRTVVAEAEEQRENLGTYADYLGSYVGDAPAQVVEFAMGGCMDLPAIYNPKHIFSDTGRMCF